MQWSAKSFGSCQSGAWVGQQGAAETSEDTSTLVHEQRGKRGKQGGLGQGGRAKEEKKRKVVSLDGILHLVPLPSPTAPSSFSVSTTAHWWWDWSLVSRVWVCFPNEHWFVFIVFCVCFFVLFFKYMICTYLYVFICCSP